MLLVFKATVFFLLSLPCRETAAWERRRQPGTDSSLGKTDSLGQIHSIPGQTVSSLGETETDGSLGETTAQGRQTTAWERWQPRIRTGLLATPTL